VNPCFRQGDATALPIAAAAIAAAAADDDDADDAAFAAALPLPLPLLLPRLPLPVLLLRSLRRPLAAAAASVKICCSCHRLGRRRLHGARGSSERPLRWRRQRHPARQRRPRAMCSRSAQQRKKMSRTDNGARTDGSWTDHPHKAIVAI